MAWVGVGSAVASAGSGWGLSPEAPVCSAHKIVGGEPLLGPLAETRFEESSMNMFHFTFNTSCDTMCFTFTEMRSEMTDLSERQAKLDEYDEIERLCTDYREVLRDCFYHWDEQLEKVCVIHRGKSGYSKMPANGLIRTQYRAQLANDTIGHSEAEVKAAVICSMFGGWADWDQKVILIEEGEWDV